MSKLRGRTVVCHLEWSEGSGAGEIHFTVGQTYFYVLISVKIGHPNGKMGLKIIS